MSITTETITRLRETVAFIGQEPRRLDMHQALAPARYLDDEKQPPCGSVGCLAGWRVAMINPQLFNSRVTDRMSAEYIGFDWDSVEERAQVSLGLTDEQADRLFHVRNWPANFAYAYRSAESPQQKWEALRDRVEHFIATGGEA